MERQDLQKKYYDSKSTKPLDVLQPGENIRVRTPLQKTWEPGKVIQKHVSPRSYIIQTTDGEKYRRNRVHLRPSSENSENFNAKISNEDFGNDVLNTVNETSIPTNKIPLPLEQAEPLDETVEVQPMVPRRSIRLKKQTVRFGYDQ